MAHSSQVRLALPAEAAQIASAQRRAWRSDPDLVAQLDLLTTEEMTQAWHQAIVRPPMAHYRVLVGVDPQGQVVAFAATGPSGDEDAQHRQAQLGEFLVVPDARGSGHGSRLMNAVVDTMRADGYQLATWWIRTRDDALRAFALDCGWAPDGAFREIGDDTGHRIKQVRLHTDLGLADPEQVGDPLGQAGS